ncbi:MAG: HTTM domain-containing protein [Bacteroidota bacterium]
MMSTILTFLNKPSSAYTLAYYRIGLGTLILVSTLRFIYLGWIDMQYLQPAFHFPYYGFEYCSAPPAPIIYAVFGLLCLSSTGVILGYRFRLMSILMFICFTYIELWDISFYLNHYYAVSLFCLILCFLPANSIASLDGKQARINETKIVPYWTHCIILLQIGIIYVFAGIAKINTDWLIDAMPLKIWLPAHSTIPIIGPLLSLDITAYIFSWFGMLYDMFIILFLINKSTRILAFVTVIVFHALTGLLFQIGVFPIVMMFMATMFFDSAIHESILTRLFGYPTPSSKSTTELSSYGLFIFSLYVFFQLFFPFRYLLYPGNHQWTEQGYRFGWRVMLTEKSGNAQFTIKDRNTGKIGYVNNTEWLTLHQEKQMSYQPDMILAFAHFLHDQYQLQGINDPIVHVDCWVTMNGRPSARLINPTVDLSRVQDGWYHKDWIALYPGSIQ